MDTLPVVLLVDDDPTALAILSGMLKQEGFGAIGAATVKEAEDIIARESFNLAILDVNLPDGNGLDLCRLMKSGSRRMDAPVLMLSADDDVRTKVAGFEAGAVDYVTKPFHRTEVLARVRTHLRLHDAYRSVIELQSLKLAQLADAQQALIPRPEKVPGARFEIFYKPLQEAGGDLCQVFELGPHLHDYIVADVCGHNVGTAMTMAALQALFVQNSSALYSPCEILQTVNRVVCSFIPEGQYVTAVYARLNRKTNRLSLVNAGHPPAVLHKGDGSVSPSWQKGDVVGAFESPEFGAIDLAVRPGDRVFLFSDALIENSFGTRWRDGVEQFAKVCGKLGEMDMQKAVTRLAELSMESGVPTDDVTLMGIEV